MIIGLRTFLEFAGMMYFKYIAVSGYYFGPE
jgi:FMN-dependent NADH-azoreductase